MPRPCIPSPRSPSAVRSFGGGGRGRVVPLVVAGSRIFAHHSPFPPREQWLAVAVQGAVVEVDVVEVVEVVVRPSSLFSYLRPSHPCPHPMFVVALSSLFPLRHCS
jgi:hypothetical protein